ncbi:hypothetical protein C8024_06005 [Sphingopyxis sp. BSNA05]|uniref:alpha/beta hydrolase n=1 Tax=Sphingopyxis sp. BSNA05 TaxID=1236614 RepID=UPI00156626B3|nr:alpha/beta hydrolase [Sphingopyxis sp. BSNA05]NRD89097.1 hypothetical protein [Sphingopyxis sp. BSNA05]
MKNGLRTEHRTVGLFVFYLVFVTFALTPAFAADLRNNSVTFKDLPYAGDRSADRQKLDLYLPQSATPKHASIPVLVYVHGGAWTRGNKNRLELEDVQAYRSKGIIVAALNYRLGPQNKFPDNINDLRTAADWLSKNISRYGGDPQNMVIVGHSAGAHLVAMAEIENRNSTTHRAAKSHYKAIFAIDSASYNLTLPRSGKLSRWINQQKYYTFGKSRRGLKAASPTLQVIRNGDYSPFYLYATQTRPDAIASAKEFEMALKASGNAVRATVIKGGLSHADMNKAIFDQQSQIYDAIYRILKKPSV